MCKNTNTLDKNSVKPEVDNPSVGRIRERTEPESWDPAFKSRKGKGTKGGTEDGSGSA